MHAASLAPSLPPRQQPARRRSVRDRSRQRARAARAPRRREVLLRPGPHAERSPRASNGSRTIVYHSQPRHARRSHGPVALSRPQHRPEHRRAISTLADRAALLSKADLVTAMVAEFPELQGTMGRYYALHDGEPADVADAIAAALPAAPCGRCAARTPGRAGARARRQAGVSRRPVRHRCSADRRQGSVRAAARRDWRSAHPDREAARAAAFRPARPRIPGLQRRSRDPAGAGRTRRFPLRAPAGASARTGLQREPGRGGARPATAAHRRCCRTARRREGVRDAAGIDRACRPPTSASSTYCAEAATKPRPSSTCSRLQEGAERELWNVVDRAGARCRA